NHPEIATFPDGRLVVFYEANQANGPRTLAMRVGDAQGSAWSEPVTVATNAVGPRFTHSGERAALAFTRFDGNRPSVVIQDWRHLFATVKDSNK
ncbi:MAG TPA: sialidase family protein, partial [Thermoanaerobaculia bacterium]